MPVKSDTAAIEKAKKKLGKLIFKCREGNLSQRQLAQAVGLHPSNMKYIEDGVNSPTAEVYTKLIRILSPPPKRLAELDQAYMVIRNTPPPDVCDRVKKDPHLMNVIRAMDDTGFLYFDKNGKPMVALHWEKYFIHAVNKYNSIYKVQLPKISPHVCRHTFCSNMAKSGMNPKTLQKLMGHSDISVTLNTYTHVDFEDNAEELNRVVKLVNNGEKKRVSGL